MDAVVYNHNAGESDSSFSSALWDIEDLEYDCDCPGPPPIFKIPPPPRPPFMPEIECSDFVTQDFENCDLMTVTDAGYHGSPTIPTLTILGICVLLLLTGAFVVFVFAWKNKRKVQNFLPCKSSSQNRCDMNHSNGVIYEDLATIRPRNAVHPGSFEMLDVKSTHGNNYVIGRPPVFNICTPTMRQEHQYYPPPRPQDPGNRRYCSQDLYNPVYEELSNGSGGDRGESDADSVCVRERLESEDEFAEDELSVGEHYHHIPRRHHSVQSGTSSLQASTGNDLCRDVDSSDPDDRSRFLCHRSSCLRGQNYSRNLSLPPGRRVRNGNGRCCSNRDNSQQHRPVSLDRRRADGSRKSRRQHDTSNEFHEGMLLDALYKLYPNIIRSDDRGAESRSNGSDNQHQRQQRAPYILPASGGEFQPVVPYETVQIGGQFDRGGRRVPQYQGARNDPSFRHANKVLSQDSDSGYSNNTSGGHGSGSSRGRNDPGQRMPSPGDYPL